MKKLNAKYLLTVYEKVYCFIMFREFEIILKKMNWPLTTTESIEFTKLNNFKQSFQSSASNLIKIQLPYPFK